MNLYEIETNILDCIDEETGEVIDAAKLDELDMARDTKIENIALWIKNLEAEAEAYAKEKKVFEDKKRVAENKAEGLKKYLSAYLNGAKFKTSKVSLSYRKSESVEVEDMAELEKYCVSNGLKLIIAKTEFKPDKATIKEIIKDGREVAGCRLVSKSNLQIK